MKKPNIVIILTDQQNYKMMSCTGNKWVKTPHLDALAREGMRFTNVHCSNPVCIPSRFSLMTGLYPSAINVRSNEIQKEMTGPVPSYILDNGLGKLLKEQGYQTYYGGKEHLPNFEAADIGFDYYCGNEREILADETARLIQNMSLDRPFCMVTSFINPHDICFMAIHDFAKETSFPQQDAMLKRRHAQIEKLAEIEQELEKWGSEKFFGEICPPLPDNYQPAKDEPEAIRMLQAQRPFKKLARELYSDERWRMHRWIYARLTEMVDEQIGQVLNAIRERGVWDDTVIVFTSDHGDMDASHKMEHKTALYQEAARVPMLVKDTEKHTGICDALVCNGLDLIPTVLDYAGARMPDYLEGKSFRICMKDPNGNFRDHVMVESEFGRMTAMPDSCYQLYDRGADREQFFDRKTNPGQMFNQIHDPQFAKQIAAARAYMKKHTER